MYATLRWYNDPEVAGRLHERSQEVQSIISGISGFQAYYLIRSDAGTISVSVFDDEASAKESNESAASWLRENMPDVAASNVAGGEVLLSF
jgi:heme-degrading monooxygenase HmoA